MNGKKNMNLNSRNKMKISHECPLSLLNMSLEFNDYQFILPSLYERYERYKSFMDDYKGFKILDNGIFEGDNYTCVDLIQFVNEVKPDIFVVPDAWNDSVEGLKNAKYWMNVVKTQLPTNTQLMVVLQGKSIAEIVRLYLSCKDLGYKHFAFNHSSILYQDLFNHPKPLINQSMGRVMLMSELRKSGIIQDGDYIHLLGASSLDEFKFYQDPFYNFINSIDTSLPIINTLTDNWLNNTASYKKPNKKVEDFIDISIDEINHAQLKSNLLTFKLLS